MRLKLLVDSSAIVPPYLVEDMVLVFAMQGND
jgi:hypothetical protein